MFHRLCFLLAATVLPLCAYTWEVLDVFESQAEKMSQSTNAVGLAWDGTALWHNVDEEGVVTKIDPETGKVKKTIVVRGLVRPGELTWLNGFLYVIDEGRINHCVIYKVNPDNGVIVDQINIESADPIPGIRNPRPGRKGTLRDVGSEFEGMTTDGEYLYLSVLRGIVTVDPDVKRALRFQYVPENRGGLEGLAWVYDKLFVIVKRDYLTSDNAYIFELDPRTMQTLTRYASPSGYGLSGKGLAFDGEYLWFCDGQVNKIYKILLVENYFR